MNTERAWYWMGVAVLAVGVTNSAVSRHMDWIRCAVSQISGHGPYISAQTAVLAERASLGGLDEAKLDRAFATAARVRVKADCAQAILARHQAEFDRMQAQLDRGFAAVQAHRAVTIPRQRIVIRVPAIPNSPDEM
jgi:hypothetical protein